MNWQRILNFPLSRILIGVLAVIMILFLSELLRGLLLSKTAWTADLINVLISLLQVGSVIFAYCFLFGRLEKREISELGFPKIRSYALPGFTLGILLQTLAVLVLAFAGGYQIREINSLTHLLSPFCYALVAGVAMEIVLRGILFRIVEEWLGTVAGVIVLVLLIGMVHMAGKSNTPLSVITTTIQAGLMLTLSFIYTRNLWFPIGLHFGWDLAEPGIFGGVNPGISAENTLISPIIKGPDWLTGGIGGPGNSIQILIFCIFTSAIFYILIKKKRSLNKIAA